MKVSDKKEKKRIIPVILIIFLIVAVFVSLALFYMSRIQAYKLEKALDASNMELFIRRIASRQTLLLEENEKNAYEAELSARLELRKKMMHRSREEQLMLVNPWNQIPEDYSPRLVPIGDNKLVDERCVLPLARMINDCKNAAYNTYPVPVSAFRTKEYQKELYDKKIERVVASGVSPETAPARAAEEVAAPGTSEHQLGFAIDISDAYHTDLDYGQEWTATQQWLMAHCTDYGFILRYPNGTTEITGIIYEPWHYRYVGLKAAGEIKELGVTFEEYLRMKESQHEED